LRVGTYTSPHLLRLEERMRFQGVPCSSAELVSLVDQTRQAAQALEIEGVGCPTFFELTTAMGFLYFADKDCDVVVLEVGLGGRLDSTNVCQPAICVITSISFDHQAQLGNTIAEIAGEKAGIIKSNVPVVCSARDNEARHVITDKAAANNAKLYLIERDFFSQWQPLPLDVRSGTDDQNLSIGKKFARLDYRTLVPGSCVGDSYWELPLLGRHQADNVAAALTAMDVLAAQSAQQGDCVRSTLASLDQLGKHDLHRALSRVEVPARLQMFGRSPLCIIDTAHNPSSINAALDALEDHFPDQELTLVFASSRDKDYRQMLPLLLARCQRLILTAYHNNPRGLPLEDLIQVASACQEANADNRCQVFNAPNSEAAWELAKRLSPSSGIVCATGSFFLASELLPLVQ
jgi:dihydrofolate synthase / folylpolyglutamate synthase